MDNQKHKDGMLAAGKKRLEQFRQKKQGKGSSSKQNKQEIDLEQGRPRVEVEHNSHRGSKSKTNAISSDSQSIKAKGTSTRVSSDNRGAVNARFDDKSKEFPHGLSVDEASTINTGNNSGSDLDTGSSYSSPQMLTPSHSISGGEEGDASQQPGHDIDTRKAVKASSFHAATDVLEIASKEEELCSSESNGPSLIVDVDRDGVTDSGSEVDSSIASQTSSKGNVSDSHSKAIFVASDPSESDVDVGLTGMPPGSSFDYKGLSLTNDHGFNESQDSIYQDGVPVVKREDRLDKAVTEAKVPEGSELADKVLETNCDDSDLNRTQLSLSLEKSVENDSGSLVTLLVDRSGGEPSSEQERLKADTTFDRFRETSVPTTPGHSETDATPEDNQLSNGADRRSALETSVDAEQGSLGLVHVERSLDNIQESPSEDNLKSFRSLEVVGAEQATAEEQMNMESVDIKLDSADPEGHRPPFCSPAEIVVSDSYDHKSPDSLNLHDGPILGSGNSSGIHQDDMGGKGLNGSLEETTLSSTADVPTHSLEKDASTGSFENLKPHLEFRAASIKDTQVAGEAPLESDNGNRGTSFFSMALDGSNSFPENLGDTCTGSGSPKHEVVTSSLDADTDLATIEQGTEVLVSEAGQLKLESDTQSSPRGNESKWTEKADVCSQSSCLERSLSALDASKSANHVEVQDSRKRHAAVPLPVSPGVCVEEVPLLIKATEGFEEVGDPSVSRSLLEDLDSNAVLEHNKITRNTDFLAGQESRMIHSSNFAVESVQMGQDIVAFDNSISPLISDTSASPFSSAMEVKDDKVVIRELQDPLHMKETELENIITLMNAQAAKNSEERRMFVGFLMHVVKRLSHFDSQGSVRNEYVDLQFELFDADIAESTKFDHFVQDCDCLMDKMQKDLEEMRELEATKRHLEDTQFLKDTEMQELRKQVEDLSQKCYELQKDSRHLEDTQSLKDTEMQELHKQVEDLSQKCYELQKDSQEKEQQLKSRASVLEELLTVKDMDIQRLSDVVSELSRKCDLTMGEMVKSEEERLNMEGNVRQLEALLIVKDTDIGKLYDEVSELSTKCDSTMVELANSVEEKANLDGKLKELENFLLAKDTDLERMSESMSELSQKCDLTLAEMGKVLEEKENLEGDRKHFENLHAEKESNVRQLEALLIVKDTDIRKLSDEVSELSKKCDSTMIELAKSVEERANLDGKLKSLEDLLSAKETDLGRMSESMSELSQKCDLTLAEMGKVLEEKVNLEGELKHFENLHVEQESNSRQVEALLKVKDRDVRKLSDKVSELSKNCDLTMVELAKSVEEKAYLDGKLKDLEDLLSAKEIDLGRMSESMSELSQKCGLTSAEMGRVLEEKVNLEGELKHFKNLQVEQESKTRYLEELLLAKDTELESLQNLYAEQESKAPHLEEVLSVKSTEVESLQKLYAEEREGRSILLTQASALVKKLTALLDSPLQASDGDPIGMLEILTASLRDKYEAILKENKDLALRAIDSDAAYEKELKALSALVSEKEAELGHAQEKVDLLTEEISKTKEDGERKVLESEQKALGVRERLSLAVTKGKGLVQQRDNLKQLLAEKSAELEALALSYQQELHAKTVALNAAESKAKLNSEAGERVEALESELSYIRNSANALRESFLQKDAVLQKIEELLEDASLPEMLQIKDTYEKVEWLLDASNQKVSTSGEGIPDNVVTRGLDNFSLGEQASQTQEIEQLSRKCDEYVRKYRGVAEELAMLEQSLLERNMLIQRWEEMLDNVDMPVTVRSKEPEDKIQWLGTAVSDAHNSIAHLQADIESLQTTVDTLTHSLQKLQKQNSVLSAELIAKDDELRAAALNLEDMTKKFNNLPAPESSDEICKPLTGTGDFEARGNNEQASQQQQLHVENLTVLIPKIRMLLSEGFQEDEVDKILANVSASEAFETLVKLLVENSLVWLAEARETREKLSEHTLALRKAEEDGERQLQSLHEAVSSKTLELNKLDSQLEGFAVKITSLEDEIAQLQKEVKAKTEELSFARDELNKSQLEVSHGEEKLTSVREKLSMAVKKGKSVVQQRDTVKQALDEKVAELDQLRRDSEAESLAFTKAKQSFKHQLQELEAELTSSRKYATTLEKSLQDSNKTIQKFGEALDKLSTFGAPRSGDLIERMQWMLQLVSDSQKKVGFNEQEAKKSKKASELLALELEEVQGRMDSLADELMHAEKNLSVLLEEKKQAEASKAEAGFRLEHAMANINSLLFELSEAKEAQTNLEQENSSLKDSLAAQMEEIRSKHTRAEEQLKDLTDLYNKMHALKENQSSFLVRVADEIFKLLEDVRGTRSSIVSISRQLQEQGSITSLAAPVFEENYPSKWEPAFLNERKTTQEWKQEVTPGSVRLLCEEMEIEVQHFHTFLNNFAVSLNQESVANSHLLSELYNGLGSFTKKMETLRRDADFASSTESLISQKDEQIRALEEAFKAVAEKVGSCVDEVEGLKEQPGSFNLPLESGLPFSSHDNLQDLTTSLVERLSSSVKDLAQLCQRARVESGKQNEELRFQLKEAKDVIDVMGQQQQVDKFKLQKRLEEFEGKDSILKRTNEELQSLQDILARKNQEEIGLVEALEKAETKIGQLSAKVEELEKAKLDLEASLGKASSRFYATVNNFNKFQSVSEKLIEEAESLHLLLDDRDAQISLLKDEATQKTSEVTNLQNLVNERTADLSLVYQQIGGIVNREAANRDLPDPGRRKEILDALAMSVRAGSESLRVQLARKDALLQDVQLRHDDLARKVHALESSAQESQRLMEERGAPEHMMITVEAEEKSNRAKHATPSVALVTHGRGGRKAAADHSALDIDTESAKLLADVDDEDKGHVFKPLTSSRLVPRGTRILVDRLDGFWVSGERLLRRRPGARLSVMLYWLVLHIWMVTVLL